MTESEIMLTGSIQAPAPGWIFLLRPSETPVSLFRRLGTAVLLLLACRGAVAANGDSERLGSSVDSTALVCAASRSHIIVGPGISFFCLER